MYARRFALFAIVTASAACSKSDCTVRSDDGREFESLTDAVASVQDGAEVTLGACSYELETLDLNGVRLSIAGAGMYHTRLTPVPTAPSATNEYYVYVQNSSIQIRDLRIVGATPVEPDCCCNDDDVCSCVCSGTMLVNGAEVEFTRAFLTGGRGNCMVGAAIGLESTVRLEDSVVEDFRAEDEPHDPCQRGPSAAVSLYSGILESYDTWWGIGTRDNYPTDVNAQNRGGVYEDWNIDGAASFRCESGLTEPCTLF